MNGGNLIAILIRAGMDTLMRHLPRLLARRGGDAASPREMRARERGIAKKMRTLRRVMRRLR